MCARANVAINPFLNAPQLHPPPTAEPPRTTKPFGAIDGKQQPQSNPFFLAHTIRGKRARGAAPFIDDACHVRARSTKKSLGGRLCVCVAVEVASSRVTHKNQIVSSRVCKRRVKSLLSFVQSHVKSRQNCTHTHERSHAFLFARGGGRRLGLIFFPHAFWHLRQQ